MLGNYFYYYFSRWNSEAVSIGVIFNKPMIVLLIANNYTVYARLSARSIIHTSIVRTFDSQIHSKKQFSDKNNDILLKT